MDDVLMIVMMAPFAVGTLAGLVLHLGTGRFERMHTGAVYDPKKRKRIKLGHGCMGGGNAWVLVAFIVARQAGWIH